jgi:hypothetical protein
MEAIKDGGRASQLPLRLDIKKLFRLDVDDSIWDDCGLGGLDEGVVPRWLADEEVRQGIMAVLESDRCVEEEERLAAEVCAMQRWLREETMDVQVALLSFKGASSPVCNSMTCIISSQMTMPLLINLRFDSIISMMSAKTGAGPFKRWE